MRLTGRPLIDPRFDSFNSRTPGGVRQHIDKYIIWAKQFQFTHPGRGATLERLHSTLVLLFQFTHPGRGATCSTASIVALMRCFNSRTPGGVRRRTPFLRAVSTLFQFTHPGRGATTPLNNNTTMSTVSIHAPREGCDGAL